MDVALAVGWIAVVASFVGAWLFTRDMGPASESHLIAGFMWLAWGVFAGTIAGLHLAVRFVQWLAA